MGHDQLSIVRVRVMSYRVCECKSQFNTKLLAEKWALDSMQELENVSHKSEVRRIQGRVKCLETGGPSLLKDVHWIMCSFRMSLFLCSLSLRAECKKESAVCSPKGKWKFRWFSDDPTGIECINSAPIHFWNLTSTSTSTSSTSTATYSTSTASTSTSTASSALSKLGVTFTVGASSTMSSGSGVLSVAVVAAAGFFATCDSHRMCVNQPVQGPHNIVLDYTILYYTTILDYTVLSILYTVDSRL